MNNDTRVAVSDAAAPTDNAHVAQDSSKPQSCTEARVNDLLSQDSGDSAEPTTPAPPADHPREFGGQAGPDPTRYGDWEKKGRVTDF